VSGTPCDLLSILFIQSFSQSHGGHIYQIFHLLSFGRYVRRLHGVSLRCVTKTRLNLSSTRYYLPQGSRAPSYSMVRGADICVLILSFGRGNMLIKMLRSLIFKSQARIQSPQKPAESGLLDCGEPKIASVLISDQATRKWVFLSRRLVSH